MTTLTATPRAAERDINTPVCEKMGDDYYAAWLAQGITMRFSGVRERGDTLRAELIVTVEMPGAPNPAEWTQIDLASSTQRGAIAQRLRYKWPGPGVPPFDDMILAAAYWVNENYRAGEPVSDIGQNNKPIRKERYLLWPILIENQITILYADGASLKSMIAACIGISVQEGQALLAGTKMGQLKDMSRNGRVLYDDHETNEDEQHARVLRLANGFGVSLKEPMMYRESHVSLRRDAAALRRLVDEHDIKLVILDSMGAALGGDPNEASTVIEAMEVLRSLKTTVLIIDHVTKLDDQGKPMGSGYKWNYSRAAFHAKRVQESDSNAVHVALLHTKANNGRLVSPMGYTFTFPEEEDAPITVKWLDVKDNDELQKYASAPNRIRHALKHGPLTAQGLKDAVGEINEETFRKALTRLRKTDEIIIVQQLYCLNANYNR